MSKVLLLKSFMAAFFLSNLCFAFSLEQQFSYTESDSISESSAYSKAAQQSKFKSDPSAVKGKVARIMFAGLGGAVFGVSTLSFYDRPQNHLSNVAVGTIIGLLIGSAYVTSESWESPDHEYSNVPSQKNINFSKLNSTQVSFNFSF